MFLKKMFVKKIFFTCGRSSGWGGGPALRAETEIFAPAALRAVVAPRATALRAFFFWLKNIYFFGNSKKSIFEPRGVDFLSAWLRRTYMQTLIPRRRRGLTLIPPTVWSEVT